MRLILATVACLLLVGCGAEAKQDDADSSQTGPEYSTVEDVAAAAGCKDYTSADEPMMFASETASCTGPGAVGDITINLFNNDTARDKYVDLGISNGAVYVVGDGWLVECQTKAQQGAVAEATEGETKG